MAAEENPVLQDKISTLSSTNGFVRDLEGRDPGELKPSHPGGVSLVLSGQFLAHVCLCVDFIAYWICFLKTWFPIE